MKRTILISDSNTQDRSKLKNLLDDEYVVLEAGNDEEVLRLLQEQHQMISVVILNLSMPVMNEFEIVKRIRSNATFLDVPIIFISEAHEDAVKRKAIELGANVFLYKPYDSFLIHKSLNNLISIRENAALLNTLSKDSLTGMISSNLFFDECDKLIAGHEAGYYLIACINIDNFKVINDQYGMEVGNKVIKHVAECLSIYCKQMNGLACRFYADKFAVLYPAQLATDPTILNIHKKIISPKCMNRSIRVRIGRYVVKDCTLKSNYMFERAAVAEQSIKGRYDVYIANYSDSMLNQILHEQEMVNDMEDALKNGEFIPFFQPQYNHATGALIGAEALVRWKKEDSYVSPGAFIPIFEKNGFVYEVDKYVWEQVCLQLRKWLDTKKKCLPVSVNISRLDLYREDFFQVICGLVEKYRIPVDLLRLEVTEAAFTESPEHIINMVSRLLEYGFTIEIDDFGSGYSSLNTLKDVPVSILKLDMKFFSETKNTVRSGNIIEAVIRMANWLGMSVIAEGVEKTEQADFLKSIGCYYIQGYLYAKPMPCCEYETLLETENLEEKKDDFNLLESLDKNRFWDPNSLETLIFNSIVGGACIMEQYNGQFEVLRVNNQYVKELGKIVSNEDDLNKMNPIWYLDKEELQNFYHVVSDAVSSNQEKSCELCFNGKGKIREYIYFTMRRIAYTEERNLFYCVLSNRTKLREAEKNEQMTSDTLKAVLDYGGNGIVVTAGDEKKEVIFSNDKFYEITGYSSEYYQQALREDIFSIVKEEDRIRIKELAKTPYVEGKERVLEFRIIRGDGREIWVKVSTTHTHLYGIDSPIQVVTFTDITKEKEANEQLEFLNESANDIMKQPDVTLAIEETLEKLLHYYQSDRVYIMEFNFERKTFFNTYEVCKAGVKGEIENRGEASYEDMNDWFQTLQRGESLILEDLSELGEQDGNFKERFVSRGVRRLLNTPLEGNGILYGFVGIDNPEKIDSHVDRLKALGDYLVILIIKRDLDRKIEQERQSVRYLMEDTPGGFCRMQIHPDGTPDMLFVNAGFCHLMDMTYEETKNLYEKNAFDCLHPDDIEKIVAEGHKCMKDGGQINVKCRLRRKNGEYLDVMMLGRYSVVKPDEIYLNVYYADLNEYVQEEDKKKRLLDNMPCGAALYEYDGENITVVHINKRYWKLVNRKEKEYSTLSIMNSLHPDDIFVAKQEIEAAIRQKREISCNIRVNTGKGEYRAFHANGVLEKISESKYLIYTSYEPVDDEKMTYQEILPIALSTMLESSSDISYIKDVNLNYICCSQSSANIIGLENVRDIIGKSDYDLFDKKTAEEYRRKDQEIIEEGKPQINYIERITLKDQHIFFASTSKYPITDLFGRVIGIYAVSRDVTNEKEKESQLETLTNAIPGGIAEYLIHNDEKKLLYFNDGIYQFLGYSKDEFFKQIEQDMLELIHENDREKLREMILNLVAQKKDKAIARCVVRCRKKDLSYVWTDIRCRVAEIEDMFFLNVVLLDITEQKKTEENLRILEEEYRITAQHSGRTIARFNIEKASLTITESDAKRLLLPICIENVPYSHKESKDISADTLEAYITFYEDIKKGKPEGNVMFQKKVADKWRWISAHATTLFSEEGKPVSALISYIDITDQYEKDAIYTKWQQSLENRPDSSYSLFRCRLGQNVSFDSTEGRLIHFPVSMGKMLSFDECSRQYAENYVCDKDREKYVQSIRADVLEDNFSKGKRRFTFEYREIVGEEQTRWIRRTIDLVERPDSAGPLIYLLFEDINESKQTELETISLAESDVLTGLLNRAAFEKRLNAAINIRKGDSHIAFFIMDIDSFKTVNDTFGHAAGDQLLIETGRIIQSALWESDLVGRLGGDEFVFCMLDVPNKEVIRKKVRRIWKLMHRKLDESVSVSCSIGIAVCPDDGNSFEELYEMADRALYLIKENGKDNYGFYQEHFHMKS